MKDSKLFTLKDSISALVPPVVRGHLNYLPIWREWEEVVGHETALNAWPHHIDSKGVLFVVVSDSIWMQQLSFQRHVLLSLLNQRLQARKLKDIRMFLGNVLATRRVCGESGRTIGHKRPLTVNVTEELEKRADALVEPIADEELKGLVKQLYIISEATR
jgi:hypothetical protein